MKNENLLSYTFKFATGVCAVLVAATVGTIIAGKTMSKESGTEKKSTNQVDECVSTEEIVYTEA